MFDLRYHVASLAAVFVALIIGILVGVGLSGSGVTKKADLKLAQAERDNAQARADAYKQQRDRLKKVSDAFEEVYPAVMSNVLAGKRIAVLFVGSVDGGISDTIETTLRDAGAAPPVRGTSVSVRVSAQGLGHARVLKGPAFVSEAGCDDG